LFNMKKWGSEYVAFSLCVFNLKENIIWG
jgi:hypothetical protein